MTGIKITLEVSAAKLAQLFSSAIEGGDPVTTARRGGWCDGIYWHHENAKPPAGTWYAEPATYGLPDFALQVVEIDDEETGHKKRHRVTRATIRRGLVKMAAKFPEYFGQLLRDEIDGPCADAFLQSMLFGEEKYA